MSLRSATVQGGAECKAVTTSEHPEPPLPKAMDGGIVARHLFIEPPYEPTLSAQPQAQLGFFAAD